MIRLVHENKFFAMLEKRGFKKLADGENNVTLWDLNGEPYTLLIDPINQDGYCPYQVEKFFKHMDAGLPQPDFSSADDVDEEDEEGKGKKRFRIIPKE